MKNPDKKNLLELIDAKYKEITQCCLNPSKYEKLYLRKYIEYSVSE